MAILSIKRYPDSIRSAAIYSLLFTIASGQFLFLQLPTFISSYLCDADARKITFALNTLHDKSILVGCLFTEFALPNGVTPIYRALMYVATFFLTPLFACKVLGLILFSLTGCLLYRFGVTLRGKELGFLFFSYFVFIPVNIRNFIGGHPRAFAIPLLVLFAFFLYQHYDRAAIGLLIVQVFLYPVTIPLCLITVAVMLFSRNRMDIQAWRKSRFETLMVFFVIPVALLCVSIFRASQMPSFVGAMLPKQEILDMEPFFLKGSHLYNTTLFFKFFVRTISFYPGAVFIAGLFLVIFFTKRADRGVFIQAFKIPLVLTIAGIIMMALANLLFFRFYAPSRQLTYTFPFFLTVFFGVATLAILEFPKSNFLKYAVFSLFIVYQGFDHFVNRFKLVTGIYIGVAELRRQDLYAFLGKLPKDVVIAADPKTSANILSFSLRKVFVNDFFYDACFFEGFSSLLKKRNEDFFRAMYASCGADILRFCESNGISYLVVNKQQYTESFIREGKFYLAPYNSAIQSYIKDPKQVYLAQLPLENILMESRSGEYAVLAVNSATLNHGKNCRHK